MNYEFLQYEVENQVAVVYINRPPLNPLNTKVFHELYALIDELEANRNVSAIVITGKGEKAFVAGADIHEMLDLDLAGMMEMNRISRAAFSKIENASKPVIAAINGLALGGGCELALVCDLRICSDKAKFAFPEVNLGIIPGGGGTQRLQRIVGQGVAKELLYFGEMIDAQRALDIHLVNKVVPSDQLLPTAKEWAGKLAKKPAIAMRMLKEAVNTGANVDLQSGLMVENACFGNAFATEDRKEGMRAFAEKRKPVFSGK
ncbi:enoyl-CoA hydratase/isomerase family protein [Parageobacillus toebii NBRC 107807]|uniref:Enoyl-CoA hydratase n=1 Tax=Parageobacillus toebii NBRC 107807 TaxID=1223503 RepID=A0A6G9J557_9BACL|nr:MULTISPECIES: enoyl-CoA hydratase-related protein [Bacillaceae]RDV21216.1 enoyl-CoA hydratase/isomerase family protein [Parageobacillus toebii]MBB3869519.1 enoyl-CoA hydratase [Parageobacillus toebii NBRC 107807]PUF86861.1 enoyl-CoA hydratase [Geobacillus sp. LYN3]QIQ33796.1 enoyl-CoA hydratase/isomerase family protein [Parageobacillus toebii NBRC 107807]TXK87701.1 enoyl-CoA hydratase/isomerase family protein [Geobacillus sp. AYS3]